MILGIEIFIENENINKFADGNIENIQILNKF